MTDESELPRRARRWLIATWVSGALLVLSIVLGLGATVWRLQQTMDLVDSSDVTDAAFRSMINRSILWTKIGLSLGALAFAAYLVSIVQYQRAKTARKSAASDR